MKGLRLVTLAALCVTSVAAISQQAPAPIAPLDDAAKFGAQEATFSLALSADGKRLAFVGPTANAGTIAAVNDFTAGTVKVVGTADGKPLNLRYCDWSGTERLVCQLLGATKTEGVRINATRMLAVDSAGGNLVMLGQQGTNQARMRQFDGDVVDWQNGVDGTVLMSREIVPEIGARKTALSDQGLGVYRMDTHTGKAIEVEHPDESAVRYISDGLGNIRIKTIAEKSSQGRLRGVTRHYYRKMGEREWLPLGEDKKEARMMPLAIDPTVNAAYVGQSLNGRIALYRITLDGSLKSELVFASNQVDINGVVTLGRGGRVIGLTYVTDRRKVEYFDPDYKAIAKGIAQALPNLPKLSFASASADERILLVRASSDNDPGHYFLFDRDRKSLREVMQSRPQLKGMQLSQVRTVEYTAADGMRIPAYLTLPPGVTEAKGLPAIVMPHGGPEARDEWGFDWLAQFFAQRGFAVLQPNFRGSAGYGDAWFAQNGFQGWRQSIGDVCDGGRWLVAQGIADPAKLAAFGWSYGGYAVLQANVLDADLFKAVVAVAPVTDLELLKSQAWNYTNYELVADFIGNGPHVREGSPAQQAAKFKAPVLMFHGLSDVNVDPQQSQKMDRALRAAGKSSELVTYPDLDHGLRDGTARADMLRKSEAFLREHLKL